MESHITHTPNTGTCFILQGQKKETTADARLWPLLFLRFKVNYCILIILSNLMFTAKCLSWVLRAHACLLLIRPILGFRFSLPWLFRELQHYQLC